MVVRLKSEVTGVVVSVSEDTATRLGSEWKPVVAEKAPRPAPVKKSEDEK